MKKKICSGPISNLVFIITFWISFSLNSKGQTTKIESTIPDTTKLEQSLERILRVLPPDQIQNGPVSFLDDTFKDWLDRTGELPPDFDTMPSIPFLPNPLILDEGGQNIPIVSAEQWKEKRDWMKKQLAYYITGTYPPAPDNLRAKILNEKRDGQVVLKTVELSFGPENRAKLTVELMIPPGGGPFPVFLTQWNHREWAQVAVRRGYIGCVYAGADVKDDTEEYSKIWAGKYDFTRLMRRAWGASRAIDYLFSLPEVDKKRIGITGHSRNGKTSLMAAAFDERISACIPSNGCTAAEVPWRYCAEKYDASEIARISSNFPSWVHPRLRFFIGQENKLPVDQNFFMALIAPRGLMLTTALNEGSSNPWGIEEVFRETQKVYQFLDAKDKFAIRSRHGLHSICARDMEDYIDFFDYVFGRNNHQQENKLYFNYSFKKWQKWSNEKINPVNYPVHDIDDILMDGDINKIGSIAEWESKKSKIQKHVQWGLGEEPAGVTNPGPRSLDKKGRGENSFGSFLVRPKPTSTMSVMEISPYNGFGDQLFGTLYYPSNKNGTPINKNLPVVIYLHEYDYSKGYNSYKNMKSLFQSIADRGYAVFAFDMLGFGNRIEEGTRFYSRYPHWSKMGKMVVDVRGAVDALSKLNFTDSTKIFVAGYSIGATVGLYAAALDQRIAGVVSVCGFTPMRKNTMQTGTEGIKVYSHLHGLLPRLGFFEGNENRIPYDFHEILACIAPRPILVIAPQFDKDAHLQDIQYCVREAAKIYDLFSSPDSIEIYSPDDFNRFSIGMREKMYEWLQKRF